MEAIETRFLEGFSFEDFEMARSDLMERFENFHGVLVSRDGNSIITPDDLPAFHVEADTLLNLKNRDDFQTEKLKIIAVLVYILIKSEQELSQRALAQKDEDNEAGYLESYRGRYIVRLLLSSARRLTWKDVERLVTYQNAYHAERRPLQMPSIKGHYSRYLVSKDDVMFLLTINVDQISASRVDDDSAHTDSDSAEACADAIKTLELDDHQRGIAASYADDDDTEELDQVYVDDCLILGEEANTLRDSMAQLKLRTGYKVAAASYLGIGRKQNEDGVLIQPNLDQLVVIDAMGGYGNGVRARNYFIDLMRQYGHNPDLAIQKTQSFYENIGLKEGGICLFWAKVLPTAEHNGSLLRLAQAGDVHMALFDEQGQVCFESRDESIGHHVLNAIVSTSRTQKQQNNGWDQFGTLTHHELLVEKGWRMAIYSDGIANHFSAQEVSRLVVNKEATQAINLISMAIEQRMSKEGAYKDNCSLALVDF